MKGFEVIARVLKAEGVEFIACYPRNPVIEACAKEGIRPIVCRQERVGLGIADGFSRVTNGSRLGVFICQHGPGAENAFPGIAQAFSDNVPVLFIPGGEPAARQGITPTFSARDNYAHVTKWSAYVTEPRRLAPALRHAFYRLRTGKGGPVMVETGMDALFGELDGELNYQPVSGSRYAPDAAAVDAAVAALAQAERPVLHVGQGVLFANATDELIALAELLDAPVITTMPGKSAFPENHPLSVGASAITKPAHLLGFYNEADCIFAIGSSLTRTVYGTSAPAGKLLIQATVSEEDVNKEYSVDHALVGDARLTLQAVLAGLRQRGIDRGPGPRAEAVTAAKRAFLEEWRAEFESDEVPINQYRVIGDMMQHLDAAQTIITHDAGTPREQIISFWEAPVPRSYLGWGKSTQLGFGLGAIMGAKLAEPERICINIMGDAAIGMVGMDLETAVRNRIGIITVLFNNGIMAIESDSLVDAHTDYGANFVGGNYAALAESLGAMGERITQPADFIPALDRAIAATREGRPALLEVMVKAGYRWPGRPDSLG
ncbi:MAG: thiamine pyrophosphate-requiring protein [Gammaproteobacteria bacterium]|nr:thiamine pyrophosphate-requiring protein [Gammaproteobacteria bacterium]